VARVLAARGGSTPREITRYLRDLRPILSAPRLARREWIREVGLLIEEGRKGDPIALARRAGRHGRNMSPIFREARRRLGELSPPAECQALHQATEQWIVQHVDACEALSQIEEQRALRGLRDVQDRLAEGRLWAQRFNAEYARVIEDLRGRVAGRVGPDHDDGPASRATRLGPLRWLFGRPGGR
jgi:hypothetical protein